MKRKLLTLLMAVVVIGALPTTASASTDDAGSPVVGGATLTVGLPGSPIDITVALDDTGRIAEVTVSDPAFVATPEDHREVRFVNSADGTVVTIEAEGAELETKVKAYDVADVLGTHSWSADLFGTGEATQVDFTVGTDAAGNPVITDVVVTAAAGVTASTPAISIKTDDDEAGSKARIDFTYDGVTKRLEIEIEAHLDGRVKLEVELEAKSDSDDDDEHETRAVVLADLVGQRTWQGVLCDGRDASVTYTITEAGELLLDAVAVDGAPTDAYQVKWESNEFKVRFTDGTEVEVELSQKDDGSWKLEAKAKSCDQDDESYSDDDSDHRSDDEGYVDDSDHRSDDEGYVDDSDHRSDDGDVDDSEQRTDDDRGDDSDHRSDDDRGDDHADD